MLDVIEIGPQFEHTEDRNELLSNMCELLRECIEKSDLDTTAHCILVDAVESGIRGDYECDLAGDLETALDEYAPPYCYFGQQNTGALSTPWGFWPDLGAVRHGILEGNIIRIDAGDEVPLDTGAEYVAAVTDHGNITLYRIKRTIELEEIWGIV